MQQVRISNQHVAGVFRNAHTQGQRERNREHQDHIETLHQLYSWVAGLPAEALASSAD